MTPPPAQARFAHFDLLFARAPSVRRVPRARSTRAAPIVALTVVALLGSHSAFAALPDWRSAAAAIEARTRAEDLLLFDSADGERAYRHYALRADDRRVLARADVRDELARRRRAWLVLAGDRAEPAAPGWLPAGWREADRVVARGVQALLLERREER